MSLSKINDRDIETYIMPELEALRALLHGLHLPMSIKALALFRSVFESEIKKARVKSSRPKAKTSKQ